MELDAANPVSVSTTQITFGPITQAIGVGGASRTGASMSPAASADAMVDEVWKRLGLDGANPLVQTTTTLDAGGIHCDITEVAGVVTVARA